MKLSAIALIAAGAVAGFVLGGIAPRRELNELRADRDALQAKLVELDRPNLFEALLPRVADEPAAPGAERAPAAPGAQPAAAAPAPGERPPPQGDLKVIGASEHAPGAAAPSAPAAPGAAAEAAQAPGAARAAADDDDEASGRGDRPRGRRWLERFDQLVTAQRARTAAARVALIDQADLDEAQVTQVDATVARMNAKLNGYGEEVIAQAASEKRPSPAQALGLGHDVSGILYEGQKELDAVVGDAAEDVDSSALQIWSYVDLEQWRPFVEKQLAEKRANPSGQGAPAGSGAE